MQLLKTASLATLALLASSVSAVPKIRPAKPTPTITRTTTATPAPANGSLAPWVTVNKAGSASTVTPHLSTVSGTETLVSGAPYKLTASVRTYINHGEATVSTGPPPAPTAKHRAGAFEICHNTDLETAPWCLPKWENTTWHPGTTYFVTWDASYFANYSKDTEVIIQGEWVNQTTGETTDVPAFSSDPVEADTGFYPLWVGKKILEGNRNLHGSNGTITLSIAVLEENLRDKVKGKKPKFVEVHEGPTVLVRYKAKYVPSKGQVDRQALLIGLPTIFGAALVFLLGTCIYNTRLRRVSISNLVTRSRRGYSRGKNRLGKLSKSKKRRTAEEDKQFLLKTRDEMDPELPGERHYEFNAPKRDSIDSLDSLADSPLKKKDFEKI